MTSPKTVTPVQPQAVPDALRGLAEKYCEGFCKESGAPGKFSDCTGCEITLAARPVRPVETPAEGLREWEGIRSCLETIEYVAHNDIRANGMNTIHELAQVGLSRLSRTTPAPLSGGDGSLREALKPFAEFADALSDDCPDDISIGIFAGGGMRFGPNGGASVGDLRRARATLAAVPPKTAEMEGE